MDDTEATRKQRRSMAEENHEHPFYDEEIIRRREQQYIQKLLKPFKDRHADDQLKKEVWDLLVREKHLGRIKMPFKVILKQDSTGKFPDRVEVLLDTKV
jgi:chorismate mutase